MASSTTYNNGLYTPWTSSSVQSTAAVEATSSYVAPTTSATYASSSAAVASTSSALASTYSTPSSSYVAPASSSSISSTSEAATTSVSKASPSAAATSSSVASQSSAASKMTSLAQSSSTAQMSSTSLPALTSSDDPAATSTNSALSSSSGSSHQSSFHAAYLAPVFVVLGLGIAFFVGRAIWRRRQNKREWWPNEHVDGDNQHYVYGDGGIEKEPYSGRSRYNPQGWAQYDAPEGGPDMMERGYNGSHQVGYGAEAGNSDYYSQGHGHGQDLGGWQENSYDYANIPTLGQLHGATTSSPFWAQPEFPPGAVTAHGDDDAHGQPRAQQPEMPYLGATGASEYSRIVDRDLPPPPSEGALAGRFRSMRRPEGHAHESVPSDEPDYDYIVPPYPQKEEDRSVQTAYDEKYGQPPYQERGWGLQSREDVTPFANNDMHANGGASLRPPVQPKSILRTKTSNSNVVNASPQKEILPAAFEYSPAVSEVNEPGNSAASFILGYDSDMTPTITHEDRKEYLAHGPRMPRMPSPIPDAQRGTILHLSNPDDPSPSDEFPEDMMAMSTTPSGHLGRPDGFGGWTYDPPEGDVEDGSHEAKAATFAQSPPRGKTMTPRKVTPTGQVVRSKRSFASPVLDKYAFHVNSGQRQGQPKAEAHKSLDARLTQAERPDLSAPKHGRGLSFEDITADIDNTLRDAEAAKPRTAARPLSQQQQPSQNLSFAHAVPQSAPSRRQTWRESNGRWMRLAEEENVDPSSIVSPPPKAKLQGSAPARSYSQRGARSEAGTTSSSTPIDASMAPTASTLAQDHRRSVVGYSNPSAAAASTRQRSLHTRQMSHISDIPDEDLQMLTAASPTKRSTYAGAPLHGSPVRATTPSGPRSLPRAGGQLAPAPAAASTSPLRVGSQRSAVSSVYSQ